MYTVPKHLYMLYSDFVITLTGQFIKDTLDKTNFNAAALRITMFWFSYLFERRVPMYLTVILEAVLFNCSRYNHRCS